MAFKNAHVDKKQTIPTPNSINPTIHNNSRKGIASSGSFACNNRAVPPALVIFAKAVINNTKPEKYAEKFKNRCCGPIDGNILEFTGALAAFEYLRAVHT